VTTPAAHALDLAAQRHGPHDDHSTAGAAALAAETIRFLAHATSHGGLTTPNTVYTLAAELSAAAARLPQVLAQVNTWLTDQARTGQLTDDQHRSARQITDEATTALVHAARHANDLARTLAAVQSLTSTLRAAQPAPLRAADAPSPRRQVG
jgi:hypothetical protein